MTDSDKLIPGIVYVGKDGSERLLIGKHKDGTIFWRRPADVTKLLNDPNKLSWHARECWISTWLEWVNGVSIPPSGRG